MTDQWKPGQSEHRDTVVEKRQQRSGSGQSGRVVESSVNGVENPDEPGTDVGTTEFLAVHLDAACYSVLDTALAALTYFRVPYDHETAGAKIRDAGLPGMLADRLADGH